MEETRVIYQGKIIDVAYTSYIHIREIVGLLFAIFEDFDCFKNISLSSVACAWLTFRIYTMFLYLTLSVYWACHDT